MMLKRCGELVYGHASFSGTWTYCGLCRGATKRVELANGALRTAAVEPPGGFRTSQEHHLGFCSMTLVLETA